MCKGGERWGHPSSSQSFLPTPDQPQAQMVRTVAEVEQPHVPPSQGGEPEEEGMGTGLGDHHPPPHVPIPDIGPPGRVQTVEVEVEPQLDSGLTTPVTPGDGDAQEQQQPKPPTSTPPPEPQTQSATPTATQIPPPSGVAPTLKPLPSQYQPPPVSREQ